MSGWTVYVAARVARVIVRCTAACYHRRGKEPQYIGAGQTVIGGMENTAVYCNRRVWTLVELSSMIWSATVSVTALSGSLSALETAMSETRSATMSVTALSGIRTATSFSKIRPMTATLTALSGIRSVTSRQQGSRKRQHSKLASR